MSCKRWIRPWRSYTEKLDFTLACKNCCLTRDRKTHKTTLFRSALYERRQRVCRPWLRFLWAVPCTGSHTLWEVSTCSWASVWVYMYIARVFWIFKLCSLKPVYPGAPIRELRDLGVATRLYSVIIQVLNLIKFCSRMLQVRGQKLNPIKITVNCIETKNV